MLKDSLHVPEVVALECARVNGHKDESNCFDCFEYTLDGGSYLQDPTIRAHRALSTLHHALGDGDQISVEPISSREIQSIFPALQVKDENRVVAPYTFVCDTPTGLDTRSYQKEYLDINKIITFN